MSMYSVRESAKAPVISADHTNINRQLIEQGYAVFRGDLGGAEQQAMHGQLGQLFGKYTEEMFFEGDQSALNPMRYVPTPFHTKFAQQRTALSQYIQQEAIGTRMRRWERPIHDFLAPYLRGAIARATGEDVIPDEVQHRRDLDTLTDMLAYLRSLSQIEEDPEHRGRSTDKTRSLPSATTYSSRARARNRPAPLSLTERQLPAGSGPSLKHRT